MRRLDLSSRWRPGPHLLIFVLSACLGAQEPPAPRDPLPTPAPTKTKQNPRDSFLGAAVARRVKMQEAEAAAGSKEAQYALGMVYLDGDGLDQDEAMAMAWFRKAADQGEPRAQFQIGLCLAQGKGVLKDLDESTKWVMKAADQGVVEAMVRAAECYRYGWGLDPNPMQAASWIKKAADLGNRQALWWFAECQQQGYGVPNNPKEAVNGFQACARLIAAKPRPEVLQELATDGKIRDFLVVGSTRESGPGEFTCQIRKKGLDGTAGGITFIRFEGRGKHAVFNVIAAMNGETDDWVEPGIVARGHVEANAAMKLCRDAALKDLNLFKPFRK